MQHESDDPLLSVAELEDISWIDLSIEEQESILNQFNLIDPSTTEILVIPDTQESSQVIFWQE